MRINGFEQIKGFYSWVFENQDKHIRTTHISLYMFLVNQNNRNNWVEWFKCPFDLAMSGSGITNKNTYYKTLLDLQEWSLINYVKGVNNFKAPLIKIEVLSDTASVPQSEPQLQPHSIPLPEPLLQPHLANNIKLLTNNLKRVTENIVDIVNFLDEDDIDLKNIEVVNPLTVDSFYPLEILEKHYLSNEKVLKAVLENEDNKFKDIEYLTKRLREFTGRILEEGEMVKTPKDFASHFRRWHLRNLRGTLKKDSITPDFTVDKLAKYSQ